MKDDRAQSVGIAQFLLSLGVGAIVIYIVAEVTTPLFTHIEGRSDPNSAGAQGTEWLQQGIEFLPIAMLFISVFGLVAYSVYAREVFR